MYLYYRNLNFFKKLFFVNSFIFLLFFLIFLIFPNLDIYISEFFFVEEKFISEKYTLIKVLRTILKNSMIIFPIMSVFFLILIKINKKKFISYKKKNDYRRSMLFLFGLILGPIVGSGLIANLYFKDNWGRARPIHIEEFKGDKIYTPPFYKSDQCQKNCSWIGGETSAAFSFIVGFIILKNPYLLIKINIVFGLMVTFCRMAMGGHFFSDNLFAAIFMIYLALIYRKIAIYLIKKNR
jgi:lipid A 4'-phosphatase